MLYFELLEPIRVLSDEQKGQLLMAMLEYGAEGVLPQFDGMLALTWGFVRPKIDRDAEEYLRAKYRRQYAASCRYRKEKGLPEISFEDWHAMQCNAMHCMPSTSSSTSTSTSTSSSTSAAAATGEAATAESALEKMGGELGKGVVLLSQAQVEDLLEKLGLDAFDHYVEKLASFILKNDARVKSHYETILKWWRQDQRVEH